MAANLNYNGDAAIAKITPPPNNNAKRIAGSRIPKQYYRGKRPSI